MAFPAREVMKMDNSELKPGYIEMTLTKDQKQECRDIVKAVNDYGVSQRQKLFVLYLLSLELESMEMVRGIARVVAECHTGIAVPQKKLIV